MSVKVILKDPEETKYFTSVVVIDTTMTTFQSNWEDDYLFKKFWRHNTIPNARIVEIIHDEHEYFDGGGEQ